MSRESRFTFSDSNSYVASWYKQFSNWKEVDYTLTQLLPARKDWAGYWSSVKVSFMDVYSLMDHR